MVMKVIAATIIEMLMVIISSSREKPRCLVDAIDPCRGGISYSAGRFQNLLSATESKARAAGGPHGWLARRAVPAFFIVGRGNGSVKARQCNDELLVFCNGDGD